MIRAACIKRIEKMLNKLFGTTATIKSVHKFNLT